MIDLILQLDWALFFSALISSTLLPGGSEALLLYRLQEALQSPYALVLVATLGNVLGSAITYAMGRGGQRLQQRLRWKWLQTSSQHREKAERMFAKYGAFALLFAWLPIVGDPLCLVAGVLRYHVLLFLTLVTLGKLARYSALAWLFF